MPLHKLRKGSIHAEIISFPGFAGTNAATEGVGCTITSIPVHGINDYKGTGNFGLADEPETVEFQSMGLVSEQIIAAQASQI
jgi:hypothetical protein